MDRTYLTDTLPVTEASDQTEPGFSMLIQKYFIVLNDYFRLLDLEYSYTYLNMMTVFFSNADFIVTSFYTKLLL